MRRLMLVAAIALAASPAAAFSQKFDGVWDVVVRTTVGDCQAEVTGAVTVKDGRVVASSGAGVEPWGYIEDNGAVSARFTQGQSMLRANGKAKAASASGAWSSNTNYCGGTWTAQREK